MDNEQERVVEVLLGSAAGADAYVAESARGAAAMVFAPEPKIGPSGGSGASDSTDSQASE